MNQNEILNIVESFLRFIEADSYEIEDQNKALMMHLDSLGLSIAHCKYVFDEKDYSEAPESDYKAIRERIGKRFQDFGFYNTPEEIENEEMKTEIIIGDAIDDISDIYLDLKEVEWKAQNTSIDDALWSFENGYMTHWGKHLRDLQVYVYNKQF